ncbi:MAG TPA: acyl-CoA dehydrogenase family protein [Actinomycetota bacterium]|nr:acyl-CoA dehydrogenase family protein [Actinomycetota bacterium]
MDFDLSPEQQEFQRVVRSFVDDAVRPNAERWDHEHELPMEAVKQMAELGLFGLPFPEEYGGSGADFLTLCLAIEELARVDSSLAITLEAAVGLGAMPIWHFGTEEQKRKWLPPLATGEALAGFGLTEPGGGSDAGATRTTARLEDGQWVINGSKSFITNSGTPITSFVTVTAVTGGSNGHASERLDGRAEAKEISAIVVPNDTPGFEVGKPYRKMGWWHSDTHELSFDDCRVPEENLLGERGHGFRNFLKILDDGRIAIAALAVGLAQGCVDESVKYANERTAFGQAIGSFQGLQFKIADMATKTELARTAYHKAAWLKEQGRPYKKEAAMAKLYASTVAVDVARDAVQVHGGYGYIEEFPVCRHFRDSKILEIGEGTSEVMRILIARELGLPNA